MYSYFLANIVANKLGWKLLERDDMIYIGHAGLSNRIGFDSIQFSIDKGQKPFDTIRF
jgi:hypothetical protein